MRQICFDLPGQVKQCRYVCSVSGGLTSIEALERTLAAHVADPMTPEIQSRIRSNGRAIFRGFAKGLTRRVKRSVVEWARQARKIKGGPISDAYADGGAMAFSTEYVPHTIAQMEAADDPSVSIIAIWGPRRDSKTTLALNAIGRCATDSPGGCYSVHPRIEDGDMFAENELEAMIQNSPELDACFVGKKSRDSGRTKSFKKFKGGFVRIISGDSITAFRGTTVKVLHIPEADAANLESIYKAMGRTDGLRDAIIILESTGTAASEIGEDGKIVWHSVIAEHYHYSDRQKWFCACQSCGHLQTTKYAQIRTATASFEDARYHCEVCDFAHDEAAWFKFAQQGRWYPTAGLTEEQQSDIANTFHLARAIRPEVRGFWRNGFASLFPVGKGFVTKLHEFLAKGEAAKSSPEAVKIWTQEVACELHNPNPEAADPPPWKPMYDRRENYGKTVPVRGLFITSFTDVHDNRLEVFWMAWGRNEESWVLDHTVLPGSVFQPEAWKLLRRELGRRFVHENGAEMELGFAFIDGGDNSDQVFWFLGDLRENPEPGVTGKVRASKGVGQHPHPVVFAKFMHVAKNLYGHHVGTWQAKKLLYTERFRMKPAEEFGDWKRKHGDPVWDLWDGKKWIPDPRQGVIHFNREVDQEVFEQFVREKPKLEYVKGDEVMKFEIKSNTRNEGLDFLVGNLAAVRLHRRPWDLLEADLKARAEHANAAQEPEPEPERRSTYQPSSSSRGGFGGGWNL